MAGTFAANPVDGAPRAVIHRSRGSPHGPITRLMSPGDIGEMVKPFIFLDLLEADASQGRGFAPHPHSGIATMTTFLEGRMTYADTTGKSGALTSGSVEWMRAGGGVWHAGEPAPGQAMRGYQLWLALPPELELAPANSQYLDPEMVPATGPARVLLGEYGGQRSAIDLPMALTYLHVRLADGEEWTYQPGQDHTVAWLALNQGQVETGEVLLEREMAVFEAGAAPIRLVAHGAVELLIGSASRHAYPLVSGYYSVHTNSAALDQGERNIALLEKTAAVAALRQR